MIFFKSSKSEDREILRQSRFSEAFTVLILEPVYGPLAGVVVVLGGVNGGAGRGLNGGCVPLVHVSHP